MIRREVRQYLMFIGVPALVLGLCGLKMLSGENARMRETARRSAEISAVQAADALRGMVSEMEGSLLRRVAEIPLENSVAQLRTMAEEDPLVRNVFVWRKIDGVLWPESASATSDEKLFLSRYALLFSGEINWETVKEEADGDEYSASTPSFRMLKSVRGKTSAQRRSGWNPWFDGNSLCLLGWVTDDDGQTVRGVEVEMVALLSHLPEFFSRIDFPGCAFAVRDGNSNIVISHGAVSGAPLAEVALSPELPHWTLVLWRSADAAASAPAGFMAIGVLLLALLMVSVFAGGAVLLRDAARQRRDAMQKTSFVSNVSHELKTPLTSIRMYAELLEEGRVDDPDRAKRFLGIIVSESKRLSRLVNNVLDFSRLEQGRKKYSPEKIDLVGFATDVAESLRESLAAYGLTAECVSSDEKIDVMADRDALNQVLVNLLDNAGKYAATGKTVTVRIGRDADGIAEIWVMDRGPGIETSHAKRIFDKFYRVDESITATTGGCGLGLGIVRLLMRGMGGDVEWRPREGGGSCFIIKFGGNVK